MASTCFASLRPSAALRSGTPAPRGGSGPARPAGPLASRPLQQRSSKLHRRHEAQWVAAAGGGDGGSGGAGGSGGSGGSGGGGGGDGGDDGEQPKEKKVVGWKGWQDRVAADPQFVYKVMVEQVIGVSASVLGDMASRPNWGLNELDFVFATLVVGSIVNFSLMYLLAPVAGSGAAATGLVQKVFGPHYLTAWGAPAGHMFQPGFGLAPRLVNFAYKGAVFAFIGMCAGLVGTATSNGLLELRKKMDPSFAPPNAPPSVVGNASCWAMHMGLSSNLRYQALNGLDMVLQPIMPSSLFRVFTSIVRGLNNMAGGISFVMIAKALGVQKAAEAPAPVDPKASKGEKKK